MSAGEKEILMDFPILFKQNKDESIQQWKIWTAGDAIHTTYGKVDGKLQTSVKRVCGKNIGKRNETTGNQQADADATSIWKKKKDKGYFLSTQEAKANLVFLPMLAHTLKDKGKLKFPLCVQPKLDGLRCLAKWEGDRIKLFSRGGKEYVIPHLAQSLQYIINPGQVLDGELYIHGLPRQDISALVKKHRDQEYKETGYSSKDLQYWIYDNFYLDKLDESFETRFKALRQLNVDHKKTRIVLTAEINNIEAMNSLHSTFTKHKGFEGTILRLSPGGYELAHRSRNLLKYKDFQDAEFKIIGFTQGVGKFVGAVVWVCETSDCKPFNVVPKGTFKQKQEFYTNGAKYLGKQLTVKFQGLSNDGIPEFPVGLDFRLARDK